MAYTDKLGTVIISGDRVAAAIKKGANGYKLIIGAISGPYTIRGRTVWEVAKGADAQGPEDRGHTVIRMTGAGAGQSDDAVKAGFV